MSRLIVAATILMLALFGLLGAAAWNRGEETPPITLTEREIQVWGSPEDETRELRFHIAYELRSDPLDAQTWLGETTLEALGFGIGVPANAPEAPRTYSHAMPRLGFVVLEYDGPAWKRVARERAMKNSAAADEQADTSSRLVPIDAGPEPEALRRRHQGQAVLILPAVFGIRLTEPKNGSFLWGSLDRLVTPDLSGPVRLRQQLRSLPPGPRRYEVDLVVGRLGIPRIADLRPR